MNIVAFGASTSRQSINKALATYTAGLVKDASVTVLDINDYDVPMFSEDTEKEIGQAEGAKQFLHAIENADALVISFAEHNGHYPAAYKNLFDWATRIERKVYADKPAVYLSASPGPGGAKSVLSAATQSAGFFGGNVKATVSVANFYDIFDMETATVTDPSIAEALQQAVDSLTD
ncbi:NADPH-dependent FMN reductase [Alteromonas sp. 14N.309.X.WAT.G.H12]|uniref:NADPH-dependent FMN reductase n=1 Tax=Alteromonas sp. 14N.309.X.WAT.G.H12 TaxID=3120824 RepID=UPI002FD743B2